MSDVPANDDTLEDDGSLAGAEVGDDELDRPVDVAPEEPSSEGDDDVGSGAD
jgi:hypothetical protein